MSTGALCTVVSGSPGAGKTSLAVSLVQAEIAKNPGRPIFVMGIPDLALPHEPTPPVAQWTEMQTHPDDPALQYPAFTFPDGALIVVDEAQNVYRPRSQGAAVPPVVAAMERHRHKGLDFILITQHPTLLDANVRKLVGKHLHIRITVLGRRLYEWATVHDPESKGDRDIAASKAYRLPAKVFHLYKSSTKHVKQTRAVPKVVFVLGAALVIGGYFAYHSYKRISTTIAGETPAKGKTAPGAVVGPSAPVVAPVVPATAPVAPAGITEADYMPRILTRPETAPMYDAIRQVKSMPTVAGCVASATRCACVNWQGTDAFLTEGQCREWIKHPPFDPWRANPAEMAGGGQGAAPAARSDPQAPQPSPPRARPVQAALAGDRLTAKPGLH